jgi:hypothetical protein
VTLRAEVGAAAGATLPERPVISTPPRLRPPAEVAAEHRRVARQPALGAAGLVLVVPIAVALAVGYGGPEGSLVVLGPLVTFSLVPTAAVAFWWQDWPGTAVGPAWLSGWFDTLVIAVVGVGLTLLGQAVVGDVDLRGVFDPDAGPGDSPTFPATLPLAGAAFTAMLQFTLVTEGWPVRRLPRIPAGLLAMAVAWAAALAVHQVAPAGGASLGALLVVIGAWQVWLYVTWRGWPLRRIAHRPLRLLVANAVVLLGGWASYALLRLAADPRAITAAAGTVIAAALVVSMLFENAVRPHVSDAVDRILSVAVVAALAVVLYLTLDAVAGAVDLGDAGPNEWVTHASLNALGFSVILHVAVGRRWPFQRTGRS